MRNLLDNEINRYRDMSMAELLYGWTGNHEEGRFIIPYRMTELCVIASRGSGWEHISVSSREGIPTWHAMEFVKRMFFHADEVVMQLHVAEKNHINNNPNVLHLWRPLDGKIPLPPKWMV